MKNTLNLEAVKTSAAYRVGLRKAETVKMDLTHIKENIISLKALNLPGTDEILAELYGMQDALTD